MPMEPANFFSYTSPVDTSLPSPPLSPLAAPFLPPSTPYPTTTASSSTFNKSPLCTPSPGCPYSPALVLYPVYFYFPAPVPYHVLQICGVDPAWDAYYPQDAGFYQTPNPWAISSLYSPQKSQSPPSECRSDSSTQPFDMARFTKQDARLGHTPLDLDDYDAEAMAADLGQQRHDALPLSGAPGRIRTPPPPDPKKLGRAGLRLAKKVESTISAWASLYDPTLDEDRGDGLGTGQAHRTGINFRPTGGVMARMGGFGRGGSHQRTRSMSPPPGRGRGRGKILDLGIRPPPPQARDFAFGRGRGVFDGNFNKDPLTFRSIKPRVHQRAKDDFVVPAARNTRADPSDPVIGHWFAGRLAVNQDNLEFFGPRQTQTVESMHAPPSPALSGVPSRPEVHSDQKASVHASGEMMKSTYALVSSQPPRPEVKLSRDIPIKASPGMMQSIYAPQSALSSTEKAENYKSSHMSPSKSHDSTGSKSLLLPPPLQRMPTNTSTGSWAGKIPPHLQKSIAASGPPSPVPTGKASGQFSSTTKSLGQLTEKLEALIRKKGEVQAELDIEKKKLQRFEEEKEALQRRIEAISISEAQIKSSFFPYTRNLHLFDKSINELRDQIGKTEEFEAKEKVKAEVAHLVVPCEVEAEEKCQVKLELQRKVEAPHKAEEYHRLQNEDELQRQEKIRGAELQQSDDAHKNDKHLYVQANVERRLSQSSSKFASLSYPERTDGQNENIHPKAVISAKLGQSRPLANETTATLPITPDVTPAKTSVHSSASQVAQIAPLPKVSISMDKDEIFKKNNENSCLEIDEADQDTPLFPFTVKVVLRPIIDRDPLIVKLASTDIPSRRIKKDLKKYLQNETEYKVLETMPAFEDFLFKASGLFFKRISKTYD